MARAQARFGSYNLTHAFQTIAEAVDLNSFDKLSRVPGIDASRIVHGGKVAIDRYRQANATLINSVPRSMATDVGNALAGVDVRSLHVSEIGDILSARFDVSASKGEFWARDQTLKLYADVNEDRHAAAGVTKYEWGGSGDERERGRPGGVWANSPGNHWILNGTIQLWSAAPIVEPSTGRRCHPGKDYECRCTAYPHFDGS